VNRARTVAAALAVGALLAGCGEQDVWPRWQAERALFHARRAAVKVEARGHDAGARERAAAEARLAAVSAAFPASRWGTPPVHGPARDVALASAGAAMELAVLAAATGEDELALERWRDAHRQWARLPGVVVRAHAGSAAALARLGRYDEALEERCALAALDPLGDPDRKGPAPAVLAAPVPAARELRESARAAEATALLQAADANFAAALERASGPGVLELARALAGIRTALGDAPGALAALRGTFAGLRAWEVTARAVELAACALDAGRPDSALAYSNWASRESGSRTVAGPALLIASRAWEALGRPDSAVAACDAIFDRWPDPGPVGPEAHFQRGCLLESMGQWERARSEFASLTAASPSHPRAFEATLRVVQHHLAAGDFELARVEGENAIGRVEYQLATNRDPQVQLQAAALRGELLIALGHTARAESTLVDLWRRFPEDSAAEAAALRGASLAEHRPGGRTAATEIYSELAARAVSPAVRRQAQSRLTGHSPGADAATAKEERR